MKHLHRVKGFIFIALACTVSAQGSAVMTTGTDPQDSGTSPAYSLSVSTGQESAPASARLTLAGENSKVSVEKPGTVTLVAGKSIILKPGTRITGGGFLYASIEPAAKPGKHHKRTVKVVTIEEKKRIDEQLSLAVAYTLFKPFPSRTRGWLHAGREEQGSYSASPLTVSAITPDHTRKISADARTSAMAVASAGQRISSILPVPESFRPETRMVLRL